MASPENHPPPFPPQATAEASSSPQSAFRFSTRELLILTAVVASGCVVATVFPRSLAQIVIGGVWLAATGWVVIGALYGRSEIRAFCIGAAIVMCSMWTGMGGHFMDGVNRSAILLGVEAHADSAALLWLDTIVLALAAALNGWCCVYARRYFERR